MKPETLFVLGVGFVVLMSLMGCAPAPPASGG